MRIRILVFVLTVLAILMPVGARNQLIAALFQFVACHYHGITAGL